MPRSLRRHEPPWRTSAPAEEAAGLVGIRDQSAASPPPLRRPPQPPDKEPSLSHLLLHGLVPDALAVQWKEELQHHALDFLPASLVAHGEPPHPQWNGETAYTTSWVTSMTTKDILLCGGVNSWEQTSGAVNGPAADLQEERGRISKAVAANLEGDGNWMWIVEATRLLEDHGHSRVPPA